MLTVKVIACTTGLIVDVASTNKLLSWNSKGLQRFLGVSVPLSVYVGTLFTVLYSLHYFWEVYPWDIISCITS